MKLVTKAMANELMAAYEHAAETGESPTKIIAKFFTPWANATWWITEAMPVDLNGAPTDIDHACDWHMYGFADLGHGPDQAELGYVMLSDLEGLRGPAGLRIERDMRFTGEMPEILAKYGRAA